MTISARRFRWCSASGVSAIGRIQNALAFFIALSLADELLTTRVRAFDFNNLLLTIVGKGDKQRIVPFSTELRKQLTRFGH